MTQRIRFRLSKISMDEENENLKNLLENYISRSEELEEKESHVIKQVERLQAALTSLQAWNEDASSLISTAPARMSKEEIEEETRKIREETKRIQEEVRQKIEENKKLQDEVNRRKSMETGAVDEFVTDDYLRKMEEETRQKRIEREQIESRAMSSVKEPNEDPGLKFFNEKLSKLREMEKRLKKESSEEEVEKERTRRELKKKIELLEWESEVDRQLISSLKKKFVRN